MSDSTLRRHQLLDLCNTIPEYAASPQTMFRDMMLLGVMGRLQLGATEDTLRADVNNIIDTTKCLEHSVVAGEEA
jgi:hypothetical protein